MFYQFWCKFGPRRDLSEYTVKKLKKGSKGPDDAARPAATQSSPSSRKGPGPLVPCQWRAVNQAVTSIVTTEQPRRPGSSAGACLCSQIQVTLIRIGVTESSGPGTHDRATTGGPDGRARHVTVTSMASQLPRLATGRAAVTNVCSHRMFCR